MSADPSSGAADKEAPKLSPVEAMKEQSRGLRGGIAEELTKDSDHFSESDKNLIKFHGFYQQEDRDAQDSTPGRPGKAPYVHGAL